MIGLIVSVIVASLACAYCNAGLRLWTGITTAVLAAFTVTGAIGWIGASVCWLLLAAVVLPLNLDPWRRRYLIAPLLELYRRLTPALSDTEQVALEAGTVGWEGELFSGRPRWRRLLRRRTPELSAEEKAFIDGPVEAFCDQLDEWKLTHEDTDLPPEAWRMLREQGFFGLIIPKDYGGHGFSALAHRAMLQKIGGMSGTAGSIVSVPNSLGPAELLLHYGTEEQKNHYLPRLADGREIPCFGLTSPTAGSDATSITDHGVVCKGRWNGEEVLGMRLNFNKRYITLAPVATVIGLAFRLYDPDGLLGGREDIGISLALIPRETPGLKIGRRHLPLNVPFQNGPIEGEDVFVPLDTLIGGPEMAGNGWRMLVECLSVGRAISLPSCSTGGAKLATLATGAYARIRQQFGLPIGRFEGVEEALARMAGNTYAVSALSKMTAIAVDQGEKPAVPSAIAKYHATERAREVITDAMDVHGGKGVILGPRNYLGRAWQGAPIWITVEGANILTRSMMIFGQGAIRCHPFLLREMAAAAEADPDKRLRDFDRLIMQHIGHSIANAARAVLLGLGGFRFAAVPGDRRTSRYYRKLTRYSAGFALVADATMLLLGGKLKQKERISARLGDVLSELYIASAMLKRFEDQGRPAADQPILAWAFHDCVYRAQQALRGVLDNFPNRAAGALLRGLVFPLGARERRPNDRLGHKVAALLLAPSETRDRLTDGVYRAARPGYPIGEMEAALPEIIAAEPLMRRMIKAERKGEITGLTPESQMEQAFERGVLDRQEVEQLRAAQAMVTEVIAVDDFDTGDLRAGAGARAGTDESRDRDAA